MELFTYVMHPITHLVIIIIFNLLKVFKVIKWSWLVVNIPTIPIAIFWIIVFIAVTRMIR